jgi:hypothetical protein
MYLQGVRSGSLAKVSSTGNPEDTAMAKNYHAILWKHKSQLASEAPESPVTAIASPPARIELSGKARSSGTSADVPRNPLARGADFRCRNTGKSRWIRTCAEMPHLGLRGKDRSKMLVMDAMTPEEARAYFKRWELVRDVEAAELRRATMETKFQQLAALMASRHLFGPEPDRDAQVHEVRDRWTRLRRALGG